MDESQFDVHVWAAAQVHGLLVRAYERAANAAQELADELRERAAGLE
jgi:hypothetical protein